MPKFFYGGAFLLLVFSFLYFTNSSQNQFNLVGTVYAQDSIGGGDDTGKSDGGNNCCDSTSTSEDGTSGAGGCCTDNTGGVGIGASEGIDPGIGGGSDPGVDGGGDSGYVPPDGGGNPVQTLTSVIPAGCSGIYPLVRYDFTASWSSSTVNFEVWRWRKDLDNWTVIREVAAPGSYLDDRLDYNSYSAPFTEYSIKRVDTRFGTIETNHIQINVQNCNPTTAPPAPPPPAPPAGGDPPPPANAAVTITSAANGACSGVYPRVDVSFSSNFNPAGGYELWHFNNPYRGWEKFGNAASPGTYTDTMADSNWYQGVTTYMVRAIDSGGGRLVDSNNVAITTANCNPQATGGEVVTLNSAVNTSCAGIYPRVAVNFSSNFSPPGGYQLWHINNPYRGWEVFATANAPGTYIDERADSNWYQGVTTYMVRAVDSSGGRLLDSNNIAIVTSNCSPPSPAQFINSPRLRCVGNESRMAVYWTVPSQFNASRGDRYYIYRKDGADNMIQYGPTDANSFEDGNLTPGQIYSFNIRAVTVAGVSDSGWSNPGTALNCFTPVTNLYINGSRVPPPITPGNSVVLTWDSVNAQDCTATSNPAQPFWDSVVGQKSLSGSQTSDVLTSPPNRYTFVLTCTNRNIGIYNQKTVILDLKSSSSCIKTTGGDVHSNQEISAPADCP